MFSRVAKHADEKISPLSKDGYALQASPRNERRVIAEPLSPDAAIRLSQERSAAVFANFTKLQAILDRHEEVIRKRWHKKTREQRKNILLDLWPNMPPNHRPDIKAYRAWRRIYRTTPTKTNAAYRDKLLLSLREPCMWPHVNLEDLGAGITMLQLLNARGRNSPAEFASPDHLSLQLGRQTNCLPEVTYCGGVVSMQSFVPGQYGIIKVAPGTLVSMSWPNLRIVPESSNDGLEVLEVQERLLRFLVDFCITLIPEKDLANTSFPVLPEPPPLVSSGAGEWLSTSKLALESPYTAPKKIDLNRLRQLVQAKCLEARDHHLALREDPAYFADFVAEKEHPSSTYPLVADVYWDQRIVDVISMAYEDIPQWNWFEKQLEDFIQKDEPSTYEATGYLDANMKLRYILESRLLHSVVKAKVNEFFPAMPSVSSHFVHGFFPSESGVGAMEDDLEDLIATLDDTRLEDLGDVSCRRVFAYDLNPETGRKESTTCMPRSRLNYDDDLIFIWTQFTTPVEEYLDIGTLSCELERYLGREQTQKNRVTPFFARIIADVGLVGVIKSQLALLKPEDFRQTGIDIHIWDTGALRDWVLQHVRPLVYLQGLTNPIRLKEGQLRLGKEGNLKSGNFYYPVNERRTRKNTEAMQRAERHLDMLWGKFDRHMAQGFPAKSWLALLELTPLKCDLERIPDWIEPEDISVHTRHTQVEPIVNLDFGHKDEPNYTPAPESRERLKTRGEAAKEKPSTVTPETQTEDTTNTPVFPVKKRAFKAFSTLFYKPSTSQQPGELPWSEFLHTMSAIHFESEKLYGSVWQFTPRDARLHERAISFHEPHPSVKMAFRVARRCGRRLNRTYGLCGQSFVLG
ncbi:hypothetical protein GGR57DRAFT_506762 [Xylariaceae sp. FL1272]|nr:hypothetical protein GGR57DRAFT_506762 [Xylariaceae sp. FL1272]